MTLCYQLLAKFDVLRDNLLQFEQHGLCHIPITTHISEKEITTNGGSSQNLQGSVTELMSTSSVEAAECA